MFQPGFDQATESRNAVRSLAEFQSDPAELLAEVQRSRKPLVLTVENKPAIIVQDAESFQRLQDRIYELETVQAVQVGLDDLKAGRVRPAREALAEVGAKFGFSS